MKSERKFYFDFDKDVVDAVDTALQTCSMGDPADETLMLISLLKMDGFEIKRAKTNEN